MIIGEARMFRRAEQLSGVGWRFCREDEGMGESQDELVTLMNVNAHLDLQ